MPEYYQPVACHYHYLHMAQGNYRDFLRGETVWLKKYFYVLRPVLACRWIERGYGVVPILFQTLAERVLEESEAQAAIQDLMRRKRAGQELDRGPHIPALSSLLAEEMVRLSTVPAPPAAHAPPARLDPDCRRPCGNWSELSLEKGVGNHEGRPGGRPFM
jgi:predicted nucleotidyltransferase